MYLLRCKYLHLFKKKIVLGHLNSEGDTIFIIIKKKLLKLDIPMTSISYYFKTFKNIFNSVI